LGFAEASELFGAFPAAFAGQPVDASSVVVAYTLAGDANLDFRVDIGDFSAVAAAFNQPGQWLQGDFTYDGSVTIADFSLLAASFNQSLGTQARGSAIPEPALLSGLLFPLLLARRSRRWG
jgi:hypothetical protein